MTHFLRLRHLSISAKYFLLTAVLLSGCGNRPRNSPSDLFLGVQDGNNGSFGGSSDSVWFMGDAPVEYCITRNQTYPLTQGELSDLVRGVINEWTGFFAKYELNAKQILPFFIAPRERRLAQRFVEKPSCDNPTEQINFLFGVTNTFLDQNILQIENSIGTAFRHTYNLETNRTGGVVWLADFTTNSLYIKHSLLHEFGHVLGMPHDSVHVMHKHFVDLFTHLSAELENQIIDPALGKIESEAWRFGLQKNGEPLNLSNGYECHGQIGDWASNSTLPSFLGEQLESFGGPDGCYKALLSFDHYIDLSTVVLNVTFQALNGAHIKLAGTYESSSNNVENSTYGPNVYAKFGEARSEPATINSYFTHLGAENWLSLKPELEGFIDFNGSRYAATVFNDRGLSLRIFDSQTGRWYRLSEALYQDYLWEP